MDPGGAGETAAAKRAKPPWDSATGVDRLSALHEDILANILSSVSSPEAVRTSILSKRWRYVWKLLPDLHLPFFPEPAGSFRDALDDDGRQVTLRDLKVEGHGGYSQGGVHRSVGTWLPAAARRVSGSFALLFSKAPATRNDARRPEDEAATIELPCFETATTISVGLCFRGRLAFPPADGAGAGVFSCLTELRLEKIRFQDPSALGDVISLARCPCLQRFHICHGRGLEKLAVSSTSLLKLDVERLHGLREFTLDAPELKELLVVDCFSPPAVAGGQPPPPVLSITAPALVDLDWKDTITQDAIGFGHQLRHLRSLGTFLFFVYGDDDADRYNRGILRVLMGFRNIETLTLILVVMDVDNDNEYLMEAISEFPDLTTLNLVIMSGGHCFGDSSLHVLRICSGIRKLVLELSTYPKLKEPCPTDCIYRQEPNWETEEHELVSLEEIEVQGFGRDEHDIGFVEQLFGWATSLTKATILFDESVTEGVAKELCWMFQFYRTPNLHMDFRYHNDKKVLYAAEE